MRYPGKTGILFAVLATNPAAAAEPTAYVEFEDAQLQQGRSIWMANCEGCHGYGIAGSPVPMQPDEWEARLAKGKAVLYAHAINGFYGPDDTFMPERGGNPELSDKQVRAAVDYMTALANLLDMLGGEFEYLVELIDSFLQDAPQLLAELNQFVKDGDHTGVRRVAHSLKANGADFGAATFSELSGELEILAASGALNGAADLSSQMMTEYASLEAALTAIRRRGTIEG